MSVASPSTQEVFYATGRRKSSSARVFLKKGGKGLISVNGKSYDRYFPTETTRTLLLAPFNAIQQKDFDIQVTVKGGGVSGQADAVQLGISRALVVCDEEHRAPLKKAALLTRDPRRVERKKYGHHGARKSTQYSKR